MSVGTLSTQSSPFLSAQASPSASSDSFDKMLSDVKNALSNLTSKDSTKSSAESTSSFELDDKKEKKAKKLWKKKGKEKETLRLKVSIKAKEGDTSAGLSKEKKPREVVLTAGQLEALKTLFDAIHAKKGEGVTLIVEGVGKVVVEDKSNEEDEVERAQADPADLANADTGDKDGPGDDESDDEVDELQRRRKVLFDLALADPATFLAEKLRHRDIGMGVGYAEQVAAQTLYEEQVKEGIRLSRHAELDVEYEEGRKAGRRTAKVGRGRKPWRMRRIELYGQFVFKKNVVKTWLHDKGETGWEVFKAAFKKYGPIVAKAVGIIVLCYILKYVRFEMFPHFAEWVGAWGGSGDADN